MKGLRSDNVGRGKADTQKTHKIIIHNTPIKK